jgi:hypothetical protein
MKNPIGYKELSIVLGILVVAIIILLVWLNPSGNEATEMDRGTSSNWLLPTSKILVQYLSEIIQPYR